MILYKYAQAKLFAFLKDRAYKRRNLHKIFEDPDKFSDFISGNVVLALGDEGEVDHVLSGEIITTRGVFPEMLSDPKKFLLDWGLDSLAVLKTENVNHGYIYGLPDILWRLTSGAKWGGGIKELGKLYRQRIPQARHWRIARMTCHYERDGSGFISPKSPKYSPMASIFAEKYNKKMSRLLYIKESLEEHFECELATIPRRNKRRPVISACGAFEHTVDDIYLLVMLGDQVSTNITTGVSMLCKGWVFSICLQAWGIKTNLLRLSISHPELRRGVLHSHITSEKHHPFSSSICTNGRGSMEIPLHEIIMFVNLGDGDKEEIRYSTVGYMYQIINFLREESYEGGPFSRMAAFISGCFPYGVALEGTKNNPERIYRSILEVSGCNDAVELVEKGILVRSTEIRFNNTHELNLKKLLFMQEKLPVEIDAVIRVHMSFEPDERNGFERSMRVNQYIEFVSKMEDGVVIDTPCDKWSPLVILADDHIYVTRKYKLKLDRSIMKHMEVSIKVDPTSIIESYLNYKLKQCQQEKKLQEALLPA